MRVYGIILVIFSNEIFPCHMVIRVSII